MTRRALLPFLSIVTVKAQQKPAPLSPQDLASLIDKAVPNGQCPIPSCSYQNDQIHATERHPAGDVVPSWCDQCHVMFVQMVIP